MSADPYAEACSSPAIRSNTQRKRRSKTDPHMAPAEHPAPDTGCGSSSSSHRRRPSTSATTTSSKPSPAHPSARLWSASGSSALDSPRSFLPSLGRIAESAGAGDAGEHASSRRRVHVARRGTARFPAIESQRRLQDRVRAALSSPSMQSVLSSLTAATGSSSGSNSTVTQGSYDSARAAAAPVPRRRTGASASSSRREYAVGGQSSSSMLSSHSHRAYVEDGDVHEGTRRRRRREHRAAAHVEQEEEEEVGEKVNVFNYLEREADGNGGGSAARERDWASVHSSSTEDESGAESDADPRRSYTPASSTTQPSEDQARKPDGAARRGSTSASDDDDGAAAPQRRPAAAAAPASPSWSRRSSASGSSGRRSTHSQYVPPPSYSSAAAATSSLVPYAVPAPAPLATVNVPPPAPEPPSASPRARKGKPARVAGYELLASRLSTRAGRETETEPDAETLVLPVYRRFERLNHRILLHLQDEIAEMEEQLAYLDGCAAHAGPAGPASRRLDMRFGGEVHFQRTELLGRIFLKMNQYNEALAAYGASLAGFSPAGGEDVERYRRAMARMQPVAGEELRFLEHEADLIRFKAEADREAKDKDGRGAGPATPDHLLLLLAAAAAAPPAVLLLFLMVASPAARALLVVVFAGAGWTALGSARALDGVLGARERMVCLGLYTALLAALASCVR